MDTRASSHEPTKESIPETKQRPMMVLCMNLWVAKGAHSRPGLVANSTLTQFSRHYDTGY